MKRKNGIREQDEPSIHLSCYRTVRRQVTFTIKYHLIENKGKQPLSGIGTSRYFPHFVVQFDELVVSNHSSVLQLFGCKPQSCQ